MRRFSLIVAACLALAIPTVLVAAPPIFDKRPFADAKQAAEKAGRIFVVKGTAVWCGPCRKMDSTTWIDPKVVKWVKENAIAVAVDVDRQKDVAKQLGIRAMPTIIAFKDGRELARVVGYQDPTRFLAWLKQLPSSSGGGAGDAEGGGGSPEAPKPPERKHQAPTARREQGEVRTRLERARLLASEGKADEAAEEFVWLWRNIPTQAPSLMGVRGSFMATDMQQLASRDAGARRLFGDLREEARAAIGEHRIDGQALDDWIVLNGVLGDDAATLEWFDRVRSDDAWRPFVERELFRLSALLVASERWADYGSVVRDPVGDLRRAAAIFREGAAVRDRRGADSELKALADQAAQRVWRDAAGSLYASLLAADRAEAAKAVAEESMSIDDEPGMAGALVEWALKAQVPRDGQTELLDAAIIRARATAEATGSDWSVKELKTLSDLKRQLEQALARGRETAAAPR